MYPTIPLLLGQFIVVLVSLIISASVIADIDRLDSPATTSNSKLEPSKNIVSATEHQTNIPPLTLERAVTVAIDNNPGLAEQQARAQAMAARPSQMGALPDPMLNIGIVNLPTDSYDFDQEAMTQIKLGLSQKVPFPGKRKNLKLAAEQDALAAVSIVDETRDQLIRQVTNTWWEIYYIDHALEIVRRNQRLLRQFVDIASTKYKVGKGLQQDVLLAQVELSKLLDKEIQFGAKRKAQAAKLNARLNRPSDKAISLPLDVAIDLPEPSSLMTLQKEALEHRPLLAAKRNELDAAIEQQSLAKKSYYPDLDIGIAYGYRQGVNPNGSERADFASLTLGLNIPLYGASKQSQAIVQQNASVTKQQRALEASQNQVAVNISTALAEYERAKQQAQLFLTGIIPQSRQTVASMLAGYQVNKVDFLNLVRAQITLYDYETQYWRAVSEAKQKLADLTSAVGKEVIHE